MTYMLRWTVFSELTTLIGRCGVTSTLNQELTETLNDLKDNCNKCANILQVLVVPDVNQHLSRINMRYAWLQKVLMGHIYPLKASLLHLYPPAPSSKSFMTTVEQKYSVYMYVYTVYIWKEDLALEVKLSIFLFKYTCDLVKIMNSKQLSLQTSCKTCLLCNSSFLFSLVSSVLWAFFFFFSVPEENLCFQTKVSSSRSLFEMYFPLLKSEVVFLLNLWFPWCVLTSKGSRNDVQGNFQHHVSVSAPRHFCLCEVRLFSDLQTEDVYVSPHSVKGYLGVKTWLRLDITFR